MSGDEMEACLRLSEFASLPASSRWFQSLVGILCLESRRCCQYRVIKMNFKEKQESSGKSNLPSIWKSPVEFSSTSEDSCDVTAFRRHSSRIKYFISTNFDQFWVKKLDTDSSKLLRGFIQNVRHWLGLFEIFRGTALLRQSPARVH